MAASNHIYEVIVQSSPENIWTALTDPDITQKYYFGTRIESDWAVGSGYRGHDGQGNVSSEGEVLEIKPQSHLKTTFKPMWLPATGGQPSTLTWNIQPLDALTLIKLTHADIDDATFEAGQMHIGWVYILSSLKSLLETGHALPPPQLFG